MTEGRILKVKYQAKYPNARVFQLDAFYNDITEKLACKAYKGFQRRMSLYGLKFFFEKFDCNAWAWSFKDYCIKGNALSSKKYAFPVALVCYNEKGEVGQGHCINDIGYYENNKLILRALEPQPKNGLKWLTKEEKESAWLVIF